MLITNFMKENPNWEKLLSNPPYSLKIKRKGNLILFNYSQIESDPLNEIVKEARGTIIEDETFKPICVGFKRFYNIDEPYAAKIDWNTAVATSKEDGTLFFLYWYNDKWHVKTRSTFEAEEALMNSVKFANFKELFDYLISFYPDFSYEKLNKNYVYCLEGCSKFNRIVIEYNTPCLFHLMTRDMSTLQEIDTEIGIHKPQMYNLNNEDDYRQLVASMPEGHEGIVVRDKFYNRVKIKTPLYFQLHKMANNGKITLEKAIELIKTGEDAEFLSYFNQYIDYFEKVRIQLDQIDKVVDIIEYLVSTLRKELETNFSKEVARKEFAKIYADFPLKHAYFAAYEGKLRSKVDKMSTSQFIKFWKPLLEDI